MIDDSCKFCTYCGNVLPEQPPKDQYQQTQQQYYVPPVQGTQYNSAPQAQYTNPQPQPAAKIFSPLPFIAIALVILAFIFCKSVIGIILALAGLVLSIIGAKRRFKLRGFAIAGIPLAVIGIVLVGMAGSGSSSSSKPASTKAAVETTTSQASTAATKTTAETTKTEEATTKAAETTTEPTAAASSGDWDGYLNMASELMDQMVSGTDGTYTIERSGNLVNVTLSNSLMSNLIDSIISGNGTTEERQAMLSNW